MKRFARGLVVGKFCPLHRGHMLVIDTALAACEEVVVLSYTKPEFDLCAPAVRAEWASALYPQVRALVLEDSEQVPLPDNDAPDEVHRAFVGWVCRYLLGVRVDAVFTSENYGDGFAASLTEYFGDGPVVHICVDKARNLVPVSGTAVRANTYKYREFLAPPVYASFVKRIGIVGGESSGKTTLAHDLAREMRSVWAPEYGREKWVENGGVLSFDDLREIAEVQVAREDRLTQDANRFLFCDTTPLTTLGYSMEMFGAADPVLERLANRCYDHVLLCAPDFPFVQDGTRRDSDFRGRQHHWYLHALDRNQIAYTVVAGPPQERLRIVISLLNQLEQTSP